MWEGVERPYRIGYQSPDGTKGCYYTAARSRLDALADFRLRSTHADATILSVEMRVENEWKHL